MAKGSVYLSVATKFDNKGLKQAQSGLSKFGEGLKRIGKVAGVAAAAVGAVGTLFGAGAIEAAEAAQVADRRLAKINESMGLFGAQTTKVTKRMQDFANQTMLSTAVDDEQIKAIQAKLLTFKQLAKTADEVGGAFDRATVASLDLAAAGFGTAEGNAVKLARMLENPIRNLNALSRAGVEFTDAEKKRIKILVESNKVAEAQDIILGKIEQKVGGTAEATATASARMKVAFGEIEEQVGRALLPVFEKFADWFVSVQPDIQAFFDALLDPTTPTGKAFSDLTQSVMDMGKMVGDTITVMLGNGKGLEDGFVGTMKAITDAIKVTIDFLSRLASTKWLIDNFMMKGDFAGFFKNANAMVGLSGQERIDYIRKREGVGSKGGSGTAPQVAMAMGGIVTKPINALVGEAGPEAVIPLNKAGMLGGTNYNITVNAGMGTNGAQVGRDIVEAIRKYEKTSGRVFARA